MNRIHHTCQFCSAHFSPHKSWRPSMTCLNCLILIWSQVQRESWPLEWRERDGFVEMGDEKQ